MYKNSLCLVLYRKKPAIMNCSVNVLLLLLATSLVVVVMVTAKSVPLAGSEEDGKKKPVSVVPPPPLPPVTTTQKEKLPLPEEDTDYYEDSKTKIEGSGTDHEDNKTKDDLDYVDQVEEEHEVTEDEVEEAEDTTEKKKEQEFDNEEDITHTKNKHGPLTTEKEGEKVCLPAYCADPTVSEDGCESCDNSSCMYKGCVSYGAFFPSWKPDPCTFCVCVDGQEECTISECGEEPICHGYPLVTKPGQCCPECDYGIPKDDCGVIPYKIQSLYVSLGDYSCQTDVLMHKCDKTYIYNSEERAYYLCIEIEGVRQIEMADKCESRIHEVTYKDAKECETKKVHDISELIHVIPIYDDVSEHCAFFVE